MQHRPFQLASGALDVTDTDPSISQKKIETFSSITLFLPRDQYFKSESLYKFPYREREKIMIKDTKIR